MGQILPVVEVLYVSLNIGETASLSRLVCSDGGALGVLEHASVTVLVVTGLALGAAAIPSYF